MLLLVLSLLGTAVFAASGAVAAAAKRLDLFGVIVVGVITALGGGIIRDLVIDRPPVAFVDWPYATTAVVTSAVLFWIHPAVARMRWTMLTLDAAGLGLFTVVGTAAGIDAGLPIVGACMVGMITGVGGGVIRDVLTNEVPVVLHREIYAVASAVGALIVSLGHLLGWPTGLMSVIGATAVFALRMVSVVRNWSAPIAKTPPSV